MEKVKGSEYFPKALYIFDIHDDIVHVQLYSNYQSTCSFLGLELEQLVYGIPIFLLHHNVCVNQK